MSRSARSNLVDLPARLVAETDNAWRFEFENGMAWIAKAMGEFDGETLTVPERVAIEKGLV